jgi:trans-aconitate 2-methyltransferase
MVTKDWSPGTYDAFRGFRLRPALDLLAQVPGRLSEGDVVDLGCGSGAAGPALRATFPGRRLVGVDSSPAMLAVAREAGAYDELVEADAAGWRPKRAPAIIFSNAVLHWLPDHRALIPGLAGLAAAGGCLAVQMPRQFDAPSHRLIREVAAELFPDRFDWRTWVAPVAGPEVYARMLARLGPAAVWETEYLQRLPQSEKGHPVRLFTEATAVRPVTGVLSGDEQAAFLAAYDEALADVYPAEPDGTILMPFRRLFFVLTL